MTICMSYLLIFCDSYQPTCISQKGWYHSHYPECATLLSCPLCSSHCSHSLTCVLVSSLTGSLHACHSWGFTAQADAHRVNGSPLYLLHEDRSINWWQVPPLPSLPFPFLPLPPRIGFNGTGGSNQIQMGQRWYIFCVSFYMLTYMHCIVGYSMV